MTKTDKYLTQNINDYQILFNNSPIALWEVDCSKVKEFIDQLKQGGVSDFDLYFNDHIEDVIHCTSLIEVTSVNQATLDLYKANNKSDFKKWNHKIFTEDSLPSFKDGLIAFANGEIIFKAENSCIDLRGNHLTVKITRLLLESEKKPWSRVLVCAENITWKNELQKVNVKSKRLYENLLRTADEGVGIAGTDGRFTYTNMKFTEITGYSAKELIGMSIFDFFEKDKEEEIKEHLKRRFDGISEKYEIEGLRKDGTKRWVLISGSPIFDDGGLIVGTLGMITDIDERRKIEKELKEKSDDLAESEQLYRMLAEYSNDVIVITDKKLNIKYINKKGAQRQNMAIDKLIGKNIEELIDKKSLSLVRRNFDKAIKSRSKVKYSMNIEIEGNSRWIDACVIPIINTDGKINSLIVTSHDITDLVEEKSYSEFLNVINSTIAGSKSPKGMIQDLLTLLSRRNDFDRAVLLEKAECCVWNLKYFCNDKSSLAGSIYSDKELPCATLAARSFKPVSVEDTWEGEPLRKKIMEKMGFRSIVMIPLILNVKTIGVIGLGKSQSIHVFSQIEIDFYNKLTSTIALNLSNLVGCEENVEL